VRIRREDFDAMIAANYTGPAPPSTPLASIWDGVIPPPRMP
jgi:hypothetical protein